MASIERRGDSIRVYWRNGGRGGKKEVVTWKADQENEISQSKRIAEAHKHRIDADSVTAIVLGVKRPGPDPAEQPPILTSPTVTEFVRRWLKSKTRITPGQRSTYRGQFDREILPHLGDTQVHEVSGTDVALILTGLQTRMANTTVTRYFAAMHAMFAWAVVEGLRPDNPCRRTDFVRDVLRHDDASDWGEGHVYLEIWELDRIQRCAHPDARPLIEFLAGTGTRFSEATAVAVRAVDLAGDPAREIGPRVRVHRAWKFAGKPDADGAPEPVIVPARRGKRGQSTEKAPRWYLGTTKGKQRREINIGASVVAAIRPLVTDRPGDELLFRSPSGDRVDYGNWLERRWNPAVVAAMRCDAHPPPLRGRQVDACELAGPLCADNGGFNARGGPCRRRVQRGWNRCHDHKGPEPAAVSTCACPDVLRRRPTPHDLRHSHVAWLSADGMTLHAISRRIGHHTTEITQHVYAGILPEVDARGGAVFDRVRERAREKVNEGDVASAVDDLSSGAADS